MKLKNRQGKNAVRFVILLTAFLLLIPLLAQGQQPERNGEELLRTQCASCHSLERAVPGGRSREDWETTVQDMISRGARIVSADAQVIVDYLAQRYPAGASPLQEQRLMVWVDHHGNVEPLAAPSRSYMRPRLSPDGTRVAVEILGEKRDIWIFDIPTGELRRLTYEGTNRSVLWSPDGKRVLFASDRHQQEPRTFRNDHEAYWMPFDGSGEAERLTFAELNHGPQRWTPDGKTLSFYEIHPETGRDIWMLPFEGDREPWLFLKTPALEGGIAFSADGKWLAHTSDETGQREIVVRAFPEAEPVHQVSRGGGIEVVWPSHSKDLFYRNGDKRMAVEVRTTPTLKVGTPRLLFEGDFVPSSGSRANWDAEPDGLRFLMLKKVE